VEPCVRCGQRVCARHRRRSLRSAALAGPTYALYVCEPCFQREVGEQRQDTAPPMPAFQRTGDGWRMEVGGEAANIWAAVGTAVSVLLVVLFFTALARSFGAFAFLLVVGVIGFYVWGASVRWWSEAALRSAPAGRRRAVWMLAAPGLFIGGAALRLALLACRAVGANDLAARLDRGRAQMLEAAEEAMDQALNQ
jgi:hypothetical protein